ncbi:MAG: toprim domain-containing protein [Nitrososphaera sp.]|nr:toprim domain-containing protein [Nitrososphaera sp.]
MLNVSSDRGTIGPMGYQSSVDDHTVERLRSFIGMLNEESEKGSIIVVEGRRDAEALAKVGFTGSAAVFHHFRGIADFLDSHDSERNKMILLLDMDRTGKYLTSRLVSQLQSRRHRVSLSYKKTLARITNGKVRHVEDLVTFAPRLSGVTGTRKDLYFYT